MTSYRLLALTVVTLSVTTLPPREPIAQFLMNRGASKERALVVSQHIRQQAATHRFDPALLAAIVSVENPLLRPKAKSSAGATGIMQVMPSSARPYLRRCGTQLADDKTNLCIGIKIFRQKLAERKTTELALLGYNGCRSSRAPCGRYASIVLRRRAEVARLLNQS